MILIGLGSNLSGPWGSPRKTVERALQTLDAWPVQLIRASTLMETAPYGVTNQPQFVNTVAIVRTALSPEALMRRLHGIEKAAGRKRIRHWGPRTLDLDILDYHGQTRRPRSTRHKSLILPHPGIPLRNFVLCPILEIAPRWRHPVLRQSAKVMLQKL